MISHACKTGAFDLRLHGIGFFKVARHQHEAQVRMACPEMAVNAEQCRVFTGPCRAAQQYRTRRATIHPRQKRGDLLLFSGF